MVKLLSIDMSPNQAILVSFAAFIVLLTIFNYAFTFTMTRVFNVRFIEDRVPWSLSELAIIGFAIIVIFGTSYMVRGAQVILADEETKEQYPMACLPMSVMDIVTIFGIPFVCALAVLLGMGKVI